MNQGCFHNIEACSGDHGDRSSAKAVESIFHHGIVPELVQDPGNDQNHYDTGGRQGQACQDSADDTGGGVSRVGGHIDADGPGGTLGDGDHIRDVRVGKPSEPIGDLIEEGQSRQAAAHGKKAGLEKLDAELKECHHDCSSLSFRISLAASCA